MRWTRRWRSGNGDGLGLGGWVRVPEAIGRGTALDSSTGRHSRHLPASMHALRRPRGKASGGGSGVDSKDDEIGRQEHGRRLQHGAPLGTAHCPSSTGVLRRPGTRVRQGDGYRLGWRKFKDQETGRRRHGRRLQRSRRSTAPPSPRLDARFFGRPGDRALVVCPLNKLTLDLRRRFDGSGRNRRSTTRSATCEQPQDHFWDIPLGQDRTSPMHSAVSPPLLVKHRRHRDRG